MKTVHRLWTVLCLWRLIHLVLTAFLAVVSKRLRLVDDYALHQCAVDFPEAPHHTSQVLLAVSLASPEHYRGYS